MFRDKIIIIIIIIGPIVPKLGSRVDFLPAHLQTCTIKKGHPKEKVGNAREIIDYYRKVKL